VWLKLNETIKKERESKEQNQAERKRTEINIESGKSKEQSTKNMPEFSFV